MKKKVSQLEQLKELLLEDELRLLDKLKTQIEKLEFDIDDPDSILKKLTHAFDDALLDRLKEKDSKTIELLSSYLSNIITKSTEDDMDSISGSLQAIISKAMSAEIETNKDKIVDTLYPILGGMISRYVSNAISEMTENINEKIESGLSFDSYKRKMKSKLSGVSETELLLEETFDATVQSLFIIQKDSGLLVAESNLENREIDDPHMVASMASAIKDFINDWVANNETASEIQLLSYGNATLYIEGAGSVYFIAFLDTEPDYELRRELNRYFAVLVKRYSTFFSEFNGDESASEILVIERYMNNFLVTNSNHKEIDEGPKNGSPKSNNPIKTMLYTLVFVLFLSIIYMADTKFTLYGLEKQIFKSTGEKIELLYDGDDLIIRGRLKDIRHMSDIDDILKRYTQKPAISELYLPVRQVQHLLNRLTSKKTNAIKSSTHD